MIHNLDNIKVRRLYELSDEDFERYMILKSCMKSRPEFMKKTAVEISSLEFGEVCEIKRIIVKPTVEGLFFIFQCIFKVTKDEFLGADVISFFYALNHIGEDVEKLLTKEKMLEPQDEEESFLMKEAGSHRMQIFQELPILTSFAERFSTVPHDIEKWKYSLVFSIMLQDKVLSDIRRRYEDLKKLHVRH